jgi:hypothetical protein
VLSHYWLIAVSISALIGFLPLAQLSEPNYERQHWIYGYGEVHSSGINHSLSCGTCGGAQILIVPITTSFPTISSSLQVCPVKMARA